MSLNWLLQRLQEEWPVVKGAPLIFGGAVLITVILTFLVLQWFHKEKVSTLEQRLAAKETEEWLALSREKETLEQQVLELTAGQGFSIKPVLKVGTDEDDVREAQIKRKEQRIIEITNMMYAKARLSRER